MQEFDSSKQTLKDLKKEASDLSITYNANIGVAKLEEKIEAYYAARETSGPVVAAAVEKHEAKEAVKEETKSNAVKGKLTHKQIVEKKRVTREARARKTRVITVIDNDQRINNHTTTCTVNCSNEFFDLCLSPIL